MRISRGKAAQYANETVRILREGRYTAPSGAVVDIAASLESAVRGTVGYPPEDAGPRVPGHGLAARYEVVNQTTLEAARRLVGEGLRVAALNFASARHPGGGFLNGAIAQEESLCRASGLYACIAGHAMYAAHAGERGGLYSNYAIYSPDVPVIRGEDGELFEVPYLCSFITAPAVNAGALRDRERGRIRPEMEARVDKVLRVAAGRGHVAVVLGAWGCGVFRNDPEMVAGLFRSALRGRFSGAFERVVFAVLDSTDDRRVIGPFERALA